MMNTIGSQLKAAREAKGLTTSELAAAINAKIQVVEDLERNEFKRLAAPIYVRGFIKLYAHCVNLNPTPLLEEYAAIQARTPDKTTQPASMPARPERPRQKTAPAPATPTPPKMGAQKTEPLPARMLPAGTSHPPSPPPSAPIQRTPKFHLPRLRLKFHMPRLRMPDIRISSEAWHGIGMVAGVGMLALVLTLGVREISNRRSMSVSRDLRLIQEPPAPYLSLSNPATPPARH